MVVNFNSLLGIGMPFSIQLTYILFFLYPYLLQDSQHFDSSRGNPRDNFWPGGGQNDELLIWAKSIAGQRFCLLYTSDAADD